MNSNISTFLASPQSETFGFSYAIGGAHLARTIMLEELRELISCVGVENVTHDDYVKAIIDDNCLGKRCYESRKQAVRHLTSLYGLDRSIPICNSLFYFWNRDKDGQPLLALLCAHARDAVLRSSFPFIQSFKEGDRVTREALVDYLENLDPGRLSIGTRNAVAKNLNSTWTQSGHLHGRGKKIRIKAVATPGSAAFAILLGYVQGNRGEELFTCIQSKLLDCSKEDVFSLAEEATRRNWMTMNRLKDVVSISFSKELLGETSIL
jgi:hypothetical protein